MEKIELLSDERAKEIAKESVVGYYEVLRVHQAIKNGRIDEAIDNYEINPFAFAEYTQK